MICLDDLAHKTPTSSPHTVQLVVKLPGHHPPLIIGCEGSDIEAYLEYHKKQCSHALHDGGRHISIRTHRDILEIADDLAQGLSREQVKEHLRLKAANLKPENEDNMLSSSVDLTARLVSMMDIGALQYAFSGRKSLAWNRGSLKDLVNDYFSDSFKLGHDVKLEEIFNARNLDRIADIKVEWTDNFADHLRMNDDEKRVAIFHHVSFLKHQQMDLFPPGLVEETFRTLALLFPRSDQNTVRWIRKLPSSLHLDGQVVKCGRLRIEDRQIKKFHFWHDRLVILKEAFDESRPSTVSQWWCDRRNSVQWYTFWVAILVLFLTVFFGVVQSIEGALQVYKAYYPAETGL